MNLSRRQFLHRTSIAGVFALTPTPLLAKNRPTLTIPPLIDIGRGRPVRLEFRTAQTTFDPGKWVEVWGVNGQYLAPTVRVKSGDFVKATYINNLSQPLSLNIQGLQAPTEMVGSIHRPLLPHHSWSPILSINQPACTAWYHANTMLNTAFQVYRGIAGLWIIEDQTSQQTTLPHHYGVDDIPLILQDQLINKEGMQVLDTHAMQFFGTQLFVNGKASPYVNVPRGWVRLRIVNASLSRRYDLRLDNGKPLSLIATGLGMLADTVEMPTVSLAPSERVELLVDLSEGQTVSLIDGEPRSLFTQLRQFFQNDKELVDNVVLELRPEGLPAVFSQKPQLPEFDLSQFTLTIAKERHFHLRPFDRLINQQRFDPERVDIVVKKGSVERWYLTTDQAVGFTLQGAKFIVETQNRQKVAHHLLAWRDTVWLDAKKEITILVKFDHIATEKAPFTFGTSDLMLKDRGCLGQFVVE